MLCRARSSKQPSTPQSVNRERRPTRISTLTRCVTWSRIAVFLALGLGLAMGASLVGQPLPAGRADPLVAMTLRFGDLLHQVFQDAEDGNDALAAIEACFARMATGAVDNRPRYRLETDVGRLAVMARHANLGLTARSIWLLLFVILGAQGPPLPFAEEVMARVDPDPVEPRSEGRVEAELGGLSEGRHEGLLGRIQSIAPVSGHPEGHREDAILMPLHQFGESALVAVDEAPQEVLVAPVLSHGTPPRRSMRFRCRSLRAR